MTIKNIIETYILQTEKSEDFAEWAFGKGFENFEHQKDFLNTWNERHQDKYKLYVDSCPKDDIPFMIELWRKKR
jgi:hypothetical protein